MRLAAKQWLAEHGENTVSFREKCRFSKLAKLDESVYDEENLTEE